MQVRTLFLCAAAALGLAAHAHAAGPIAHWKLDETSGTTVFDSAGNADGTTVGSFSSITGIDGNALEFKPGNYITMGDVHRLTGTSFTLSGWISTNNATTAGNMFGRHYTGYFNGYGLSVNSGGGSYGQNEKAMLYQSSNESGSPISTTSVTDIDWHLITGVYNLGGNAQLYVDGVLESTRSSWTIVADPNAPFMMGGINLFGTLTGTLDAALDDVQIYDYALNSSEIGYMFANPGSTVPEPSALALIGLGAGALLHRRRR
jgi:hypothetical protein